MSEEPPVDLTYPMTGFLVREHTITVPVDWDEPTRFGTTTVFARELVDPAKSSQDLPLLLFLQGGPGGAGPRPATGGGWWRTALATHRVVLLDQRGTGRSGRIDARTVARLDPRTAADLLTCYRQDAIVRDAEHLRRTVYGGRRWATLGQSYGGFLTLAYLSRFPQALTSCYVTGGLPGLTASAGDVYARTFDRQLARDARFDRAFPQDVAVLTAVADQCAAGEVLLPDGTPLSAERLALLGLPFGMSDGFEHLHWLLDTALDDDGRVSSGFVAQVAHETSYATNPLYVVLQEAIYHQGEREPGWAAQAERDRRPVFDPSARPLTLTGEAFFPWVYDQVAALRPFKAAATELAGRTVWSTLYDAERLASNEIPVAAVQYYDDPYVDLDLALGTAAAVGACQVWVTNEYLHDGLRAHGDVIVPRLLDLAAGRWGVTGR